MGWSKAVLALVELVRWPAAVVVGAVLLRAELGRGTPDDVRAFAELLGATWPVAAWCIAVTMRASLERLVSRIIKAKWGDKEIEFTPDAIVNVVEKVDAEMAASMRDRLEKVEAIAEKIASAQQGKSLLGMEASQGPESIADLKLLEAVRSLRPGPADEAERWTSVREATLRGLIDAGEAMNPSLSVGEDERRFAEWAAKRGRLRFHRGKVSLPLAYHFREALRSED